MTAAVYGPSQGLSRYEHPERATVQVSFGSRSGNTEHADSAKSLLIQQTVEGAILAQLHPRCIVRVVVQVVDDDGAVLACAVNATCAALMDAAVPLKTSFAAVTCILSTEGEIQLDPTCIEQKKAAFRMCAVFAHHRRSPSDAQPRASEALLACASTGLISVQQHALLLQTAHAASQSLAARFDASLHTSLALQ